MKAAIAHAESAKAAAAETTGSLTGRIAAAGRTIAALTSAASSVEQRYLSRTAGLRIARDVATRAARAAVNTRASYDQARREFAADAVDGYESGAAPGTLGSSSVSELLVATDPAALIGSLSVDDQLADRQAATAALLLAAENQRRVSAERARSAAAAIAAQVATLTELRGDALNAVDLAQTRLTTLRADMAKAHYSQRRADAALAGFLGGWQAADPARADALNRQWVAYAATVKHRPLPSATGTGWTPAIGQAVADRAIQWIGTPYAWAGGSPTGPTRGICAGGGAERDCHLTGFDCSGLAMYAWSPYEAMSHQAADQYRSGRTHPDAAHLRPGDLVFWSSGGTVAGIHHVAIYLGHGLVVQAPQSGDIVRVTPIASVDSGYFGATRPLT